MTKTTRRIILAVLLTLTATATVHAAPVELTLKADSANPAGPVMGDKLRFHSIITNTGRSTIEGLVAWISLVEVDPGHEQPVDLEDWSAHKAVTGARLAPGEQLRTDWPMRLIQHGDYRVVISVTDRDHRNVHTSPTVQFHVARKPVVESSRILPVAFGVPLLIGSLMGFQRLRGR